MTTTTTTTVIRTDTYTYRRQRIGFVLRVRYARFQHWRRDKPVLRYDLKATNALQRWIARWVARQAPSAVVGQVHVDFDMASFYRALAHASVDEQTPLRVRLDMNAPRHTGIPPVYMLVWFWAVCDVPEAHREGVERYVEPPPGCLPTTPIYIAVLRANPVHAY